MKALLIILLGFAGSVITIQAQEISKYDLERRAQYNFEQGRYLKSSSDYEILQDMYPKDAEYAYFLGRSYLHSNRYINRATELLKFSARRNYGDDAYFYLGQAYHLSYKFEDAALAFITFQKQASKKVLKKFDVEYWINLTSNARQSVQVARDLKIESLHAIPSTAIQSAFTEINHGKYIYIPDEFKSDYDNDFGYQSMMFLPHDLKNGDLVFYSRMSKQGKTGSDIFFSQRLTQEEYSVPKRLGEVVNTSYDEAYPYYDKASSTLYFSSKGHNTSGGFDIFKTVYNAEDDTWTKAEKLDFPLNSVRDDYLFTPLGENEALFITNRNTSTNELESYTLNLGSSNEYITPANSDDVVTLALLSPSAVVIDEPLLAQINDNLDKPTAAETIELTPKEQYAKFIEEALELQVQSDSLSSIARKLRGNAMNEKDYQAKQELIAKITSLDKEAKRLQLEADTKFKEASTIRNNEVNEQLAMLTPNSEDNGITRYTYNTGIEAVAKSKSAKEQYRRGYEAASKVPDNLTTSFAILNNSPYSGSNPIPYANLPQGLVYRIQLGAFSNAIPENTFKGLTPVSKEKSNTSTRYYVGIFSSITEARKALEEVKAYGYPDAFLVSFYNRNKISVQEAREIEFATR